jgi:two-component system CheB/CheR fusion protein
MLDIKIRNGLPFPIVGLGASADDPGALLEYIAGRGPDTGMAYIVMQPRGSEAHADPLNLTADELAMHTTLPVTDLSDGISLEPDHVYVMPRLRRDASPAAWQE